MALRGFVEGLVMQRMVPLVRDDARWRDPVVDAALRTAGGPALRRRMIALADRIPAVLDMLDGLPLTYAHGDACPQNLLLPVSGPGQVVVADWGFGSQLAVGFDLGQLLVGLAHDGEVDAARLHEIDGVILPAYLAGLRLEGYDVSPEEVRAGYLGSLAARTALAALPVEAIEDPDRPSAPAIIAQRLELTRIILELVQPVVESGATSSPRSRSRCSTSRSAGPSSTSTRASA